MPRVIGHRGAARSAPENTLAGFERAALAGAQWVEFDVQITADDRPVVFHDLRLERTTNGTGRLCDRSLAELRGLDAGGWFAPGFAGERVPLLGEALAVIAGLGLGCNIEIKSAPGREAATGRIAMAEARAAWPVDRPPPLISSFDPAALAAAREIVPDWPRGLLFRRLPADWRRRAEALAVVSIHCDQRFLDRAVAAAVRGAGYGLLAFTVNTVPRALRLWQWGVDGVFSDVPELLLAAE